ncbi:MAG: PilZ domain-containing protein [Pseudomonadota bacterium]
MSAVVQQEKRHHQRIHFTAEARIVAAHEIWYGELHDISLKGGLFKPESYMEVDIGQRLVLEFKLGEHHDVIRMKSTVANRREDNQLIGLHCECVDLDSAIHLRRLVELNLGDTRLLERELHALTVA